MTVRPIKLECLSLKSFFRVILVFVSKMRSLTLERGTIRNSIRVGSSLTHNYLNIMKNLLIANTLAYLLEASAPSKKRACINLAPGVNITKLFYEKLVTLFESWIFPYHRKIMVILMKWASLQKRVSKFTPKKFYEIDPSAQCYKTFLSVNYCFS
jgi:hypothetical protein